MVDRPDEIPVDANVSDIPPMAILEHNEADEEEFRIAKARKAEKKAKKHEPAGEEGLNIVPLLDAFTIILVFLIKSYQSDPTAITQDENLKLPTSTTTQMILEAVPVVITKKGVLVGDQAVVRVIDGNVDPSEKQGFGVPRITEALKKEAEKQKMIARFNSKVQFEGILLIVSDKETKFQTLTDVLYSAGQAEFGKFKFAVLRLD